MVRAAAKNHAHVGVVVDPTDYAAVLDELRRAGALSDDTRRRLARKAFAHTAAYDAAIVAWFDEGGRRPTLPADAAPGARAGAGPALRREPAPGGRPLPPHRRPQLVGRRRAARRQGAVVPQPVRHRGRVAAGARSRGRRARGRDHQARQPVRRRRRATTSPPPTGGPTSATRCRRSAASWPSTDRCPPSWPRRWRRCSPRWWSRRRTSPARSRC